MIAGLLRFAKDTYLKLMAQIPNVPFEVGGIIGGENGIVKDFKIDYGAETRLKCCYSPNTERMNDWIEEWRMRDVEFMGIFHTHFGGAEALSGGDETYIYKIMAAMPDRVERLYFPILLMPEKRLVSYVAAQGKAIVRDSFLLVE